eukprot:TRINITY_DN264_c0_g1_i6.p3 TRINITY_DN264_c0_g1~~TRINITY_DN264_c0_g1_i6.p3  ORF type:complete len:75 (-),score=23.94 TRINITY_DN264_c0_g1_i6:3-227(-)
MDILQFFSEKCSKITKTTKKWRIQTNINMSTFGWCGVPPQKRKKYRLRLCVDTTALRSWIVHGRSSETAKAHRG